MHSFLGEFYEEMVIVSGGKNKRAIGHFTLFHFLSVVVGNYGGMESIGGDDGKQMAERKKRDLKKSKKFLSLLKSPPIKWNKIAGRIMPT